MVNCRYNEFEIKNIKEVTFVFFDFDLFDEGLQEDIHWNALILADNIIEISKHEVSCIEFVMIFNKQKC